MALICRAALIVTFLAFVVPLPYYIGSRWFGRFAKSPKVNDTEDKEAGAYQFVTVGVQHATLAHMIYAWLAPLQIFVVLRRLQVALPNVEHAGVSILHADIAKNMWPSIKG